MKKLLVTSFILITYIAILIKVMVFKDLSTIRVGQLMLNFGGTHDGKANWIPFKTILPYLFGKMGLIIGGINIVGNIILLVPIGFLLPFVFSKLNWNKIILIAFSSGLAIEGMQVILQVGIFDIDDVILNGIGVLLGFGLFKIFPAILGSKKILISTISISTLVLVVLTISIYKMSHQPLRLPPGAQQRVAQHGTNGKDGSIQNTDPCNGTGGTGQILRIENKAIIIKRRDGVTQSIHLTDQTIVRNAAGSLTFSDLKVNDHVTLVIDETETASLVLVCTDIMVKSIQ